MEILLVPHPVLRQKASKLKSISKEDIKIANHMMEAMIKAPGVGLAANQVGVLKQIVALFIGIVWGVIPLLGSTGIVS